MKDFKDNTEKLPVLFVGHGSPMNAVEENEFTEGWKETGKSFPEPEAILCISAHWETDGTHVTSMGKPETIHDFGGFPRQLYEVQYPAPGDPALAREVKSLIGLTETVLDESWGLDHGCWSVLRRMYPAANIPVIQLSLNRRQPAQFHYDLARELAPLRKKGVLIIGSGNMVHNLRMLAWDKLEEPGFGFDWALEASGTMKRCILDGDHAPLIDFRSQGRAFDLAIPTPEHFLPLLYTLALREKDEAVTLFNDKAVDGSVTVASVGIRTVWHPRSEFL
jgi:4,5-DOPA dioxygenase extradiol